MALILGYFTEFGSFWAHCVKVVEDVVVKTFMFAISPPDEFLVKPCCFISHTDIYQIFMAALWNRAGHYIFIFIFYSPQG